MVPNQSRGHWVSLPDAPFDFDLANPNLFLRHNSQSLYVLSAKQAAFRAGLRNMATGRGETLHGNFKGQRTESQHYHLQANNFDQSMVWFQNVRLLCSVFLSFFVSCLGKQWTLTSCFSDRWKTPTMHFVDRLPMALLTTSSHWHPATIQSVSQSRHRVATTMVMSMLAATPTLTPAVVA